MKIVWVSLQDSVQFETESDGQVKTKMSKTVKTDHPFGKHVRRGRGSQISQQETVAKLVEIFGDKFDREVVTLVLEDCEWKGKNSFEIGGLCNLWKVHTHFMFLLSSNALFYFKQPSHLVVTINSETVSEYAIIQIRSLFHAFRCIK